jgi:alpha-tubulin suppressor-like RCC1 family protein
MILQPTILDKVDNIEAVSTGRFHALFVQDGKLLALSFAEPGTLTTFTNLDEVTKALSDFDSILAIRTDGTLWGYGGNAQGQLGIGTLVTADRFTPALLDRVIDVALLGNHAAAVREDGSVWEWGDLGLTRGTDEFLHSPRLVPELNDVIGISFGFGLTAVHADGSVSVLRRNTLRQLSSLPPIVKTTGNTDTRFSLALAEDGTLWGWGDAWRELGLGLTPAPGIISDQERITFPIYTQFPTLSTNPLALDSNGTVWAWGYGLIGDGRLQHNQDIPVRVIESKRR